MTYSKQFLESHLKHSNITNLSKLAMITKVARSTINSILNGRNKNMTLDTAIRIQKAMEKRDINSNSIWSDMVKEIEVV